MSTSTTSSSPSTGRWTSVSRPKCVPCPPARGSRPPASSTSSTGQLPGRSEPDDGALLRRAPVPGQLGNTADPAPPSARPARPRRRRGLLRRRAGNCLDHERIPRAGPDQRGRVRRRRFGRRRTDVTRAAPDWPPSARRSAPWPNFSASTTTCSPSRPARAHRSTPAAGRRKSHGDRPDGDASSIPQRSTPQTCPPHLAGPWPIFSRPRRVAEATMSAGQLPGAPGRKPAGTRPVVSHRRDDRHPKVRRVRRRRRTGHRSPDARRTRRRRDTFTQRILALRHTHARKPRLIERLNRAGL